MSLTARVPEPLLQPLLPCNSPLSQPHPGPCYNLGLFYLWYLTLRPHPSSPFLTLTKQQTHLTLPSSSPVFSRLLVGYSPFSILFLLKPNLILIFSHLDLVLPGTFSFVSCFSLSPLSVLQIPNPGSLQSSAFSSTYLQGLQN